MYQKIYRILLLSTTPGIQVMETLDDVVVISYDNGQDVLTVNQEVVV